VAAWRLEAGGPAPEWLFGEAADIANSVYDHALAERLARRAVADGGGVRAALALGEALTRQGRCVEGLEVLDPLADLATTDREHLAVAVARYFGLTTEHGFRVEFESVLLDAERRITDTQLLAFLRAQRATLLCFAGRLDEGVALVDGPAAATEERSRLRAVTALGSAWLAGGRPESACDLAASLLEPALRLQDELPQAPAWVLSTQLPALVAAGRLDDADAAIALVEASLAGQRPSADGPGFLALARGMSALHRGRARTAADECRSSVAALRDIARWRLPFPLAALAEACALVGDAEGASEAIEEADALVVNAAVFGGMVRRARGWAALARGQRSVAIDLVADAAEWSGAHGQHTAELFARHDVLRWGGGTRAAVALLDVASRVEGRWAPVFAAQASAVLDADPKALEDASASFEEIGALLHAAEAAVAASAAYRASGVRNGAARTAARARLLATECEGARTPLLAELHELDAPVPLTSREREVVNLAADGMPSAAIAGRLFVSVRTVEGHLHRAYSKLGVTDRTALAAVLNRPPVDCE
jgi:ATP/maltotriose-dependent transcriptional regulator MalT